MLFSIGEKKEPTIKTNFKPTIEEDTHNIIPDLRTIIGNEGFFQFNRVREQKENICLLMEYVSNSLDSFVYICNKKNDLKCFDIFNMLFQIYGVLDSLQFHKFTHYNLKMKNVLVQELDNKYYIQLNYYTPNYIVGKSKTSYLSTNYTYSVISIYSPFIIKIKDYRFCEINENVDIINTILPGQNTIIHKNPRVDLLFLLQLLIFKAPEPQNTPPVSKENSPTHKPSILSNFSILFSKQNAKKQNTARNTNEKYSKWKYKDYPEWTKKEDFWAKYEELNWLHDVSDHPKKDHKIQNTPITNVSQAFYHIKNGMLKFLSQNNAYYEGRQCLGTLNIWLDASRPMEWVPLEQDAGPPPSPDLNSDLKPAAGPPPPSPPP